MKNPIAALGSIVTGVILALITIVGGVAAVSPSANAPSKSEQVVVYDAP